MSDLWVPGTRPRTPCRIWRKIRNRRGRSTYPGRNWNGRTVAVHHWIWEQIHGPIPKGMLIMHLCDEPWCYRLDHLRLGTPAENVADRDAKGRYISHRATVTHCPAGHEYNETNTRVDRHGHRYCRVCDNHRHRVKYRETQIHLGGGDAELGSDGLRRQGEVHDEGQSEGSREAGGS